MGASQGGNSLWRRVVASLGLACVLLGFVCPVQALPPAQRSGATPGPPPPPTGQTVRITPQQIESELARSFPLRRCLPLVACLEVRAPRVQIPARGASLHVLWRVAIAPEPSGLIEVAGVPRYQPEGGALYLDDARAVRIAIPGIEATQAQLLGELVSGLLARWLAQHPVWKLDERDPRQVLARQLLREVWVEQGHLVLRMAGGGDDLPAYEDDPGPGGGVPPGQQKPVR